MGLYGPRVIMVMANWVWGMIQIDTTQPRSSYQMGILCPWEPRLNLTNQNKTFTVSGGDPSKPYYVFTNSGGQVSEFNSTYLYPGNTYEFIASGISDSHPFMIGENYGDTIQA